MKVMEAMLAVTARINVLETKCANASKHNPDYYKSLKELRLMGFIKDLLMRVYPNDDDDITAHDCETITTLCTVKVITTIEVHEGDNVLDLLDKYKDVKDVYNKIKKACEDNGLTMVGSDIVRK